MKKAKEKKYSGTIRTSKQEDFEIFLSKMGLSIYDISFEVRGSYLLYTIDLSSKSEADISKITNKLNNSITFFL